MSLIPDIIPVWVKVAAVSVVLAIAIGSTARVSYKYGFNERDVQAKSDTIAQQKADLEAQRKIMADRNALQGKYNDLAQELINTKTELKEAKADVKTKVVKEIQSNTVYQSCVMPPSGVRIITDQAAKLNAIRHGTPQG